MAQSNLLSMRSHQFLDCLFDVQTFTATNNNNNKQASFGSGFDFQVINLVYVNLHKEAAATNDKHESFFSIET